MRYKLPTTARKYVGSSLLSGRKYILFLQSLVYPLKTLNDWFQGFAKQKMIEANMTSQIIHFEWFFELYVRAFSLVIRNRRFILPTVLWLGWICIMKKHCIASLAPFRFEGEAVATVNPLENPRPFYFHSEEKEVNKVSFMVCVPEIDIDEQEFVYMLSFVVNNYKLAGKTYLIKIDSKEITPINKSSV